MKKLLLLFAALLVAGCGEKSSSEGSESASENPTASNESAETAADTAQSSSDSATLPLSDADVERLLKEAVDFDSLEERDDFLYQNNEPFSGLVKMMYDSGQVQGLVQLKDGKMQGLMTAWHENGQRTMESIFKDGKPDGLMTVWHENGQKQGEAIYKDGKELSAKYWNRKGEEVETEEEASSEEPSDTPNSLSDADVERLLKEAIDFKSLELRNNVMYQVDESEPFSGWIKGASYLGQGQGLIQCKDGKAHGIQMGWRENGQKMYESTYKDGELISEKWWNAKGEEVETREEAEE